MLSTPPATSSSASPALIARAAVMTASIPEPQRRLIVVPDTPTGSPARSSDMRATLRLSSPPDWPSQNHIVDSFPIDGTITLHKRFQRNGAEIVGTHGRKRAAITTNGSANVIADIGFTHYMVSQFGNNEIGDRAVDMQLCAGHGLKVFQRHGGQLFTQHETPLVDIDHSMAGIDAGDTCDAG